MGQIGQEWRGDGVGWVQNIAKKWDGKVTASVINLLDSIYNDLIESEHITQAFSRTYVRFH